MKHWKIVNDQAEENNITDNSNILKLLLENRGLSIQEDASLFLNPEIEKVTIKSSGIDISEYVKFKKRIEKAIEDGEKIIIFGDYDVDGICASAILWETLFAKTKNVFPYIPDRVDEGYGLSRKGIDNVLQKHSDVKVIITVDNGIVAIDAVKYANEKKIDVLLTDHHVKGNVLPEAHCIVHTTNLCGAGIAWVIAKELQFETTRKVDEKLELASLATIADLVPLVGNNRAIVKFGLEKLRNTNRIGLQELFAEAGLTKDAIGVYSVGHVIAPRLNATGRIQSAMNALRMLCTGNMQKAKEYAIMLGSVNKNRQVLTQESFEHAKLLAIDTTYSSRIIVVAHETYNPGVIGIVASHLVENYYKPSFAISKGDEISKGSARSIQGVNIIELLRSVGDTLLEAGGHPMAAGFSLATEKIDAFIKVLSEKAEVLVSDEMLKRYLKIDCLLSFDAISNELIKSLQMLEPFGMGNPEPVFATKGVEIHELRKIGKEKNHLKLKLTHDASILDAIAFGAAEKFDLSEGDSIDVAYTISENIWNGRKSIQLKIRDIKPKD